MRGAAVVEWWRMQASESDRSAGRAGEAIAKILIVEDDHLVAITNEDVLLEAGFEVTGIAASADEAIRMATATIPDLVVMDVTLAGARDGVDAALELFRDRGIRCVFATAHHDAQTRARAAPANPLAWLGKPFLPDALVRTVRRAHDDLGQS